MKKIITKIIHGIFIGITLGLLISLFFNYINGNSHYYPSNIYFTEHFKTVINALSYSICLWALMGIVGSTSVLIFKINHWSLLKQSICHFLYVYICMTILAIFAGWFPLKFNFMAIYTFIFLLIYLVIYSLKTIQFKQDIKLINQHIRKSK